MFCVSLNSSRLKLTILKPARNPNMKQHNWSSKQHKQIITPRKDKEIYTRSKLRLLNNINIKVKLSRYRPGQALGVPRG
jgi:hypothetical protein